MNIFDFVQCIYTFSGCCRPPSIDHVYGRVLTVQRPRRVYTQPHFFSKTKSSLDVTDRSSKHKSKVASRLENKISVKYNSTERRHAVSARSCKFLVGTLRLFGARSLCCLLSTLHLCLVRSAIQYLTNLFIQISIESCSEVVK